VRPGETDPRTASQDLRDACLERCMRAALQQVCYQPPLRSTAGEPRPAQFEMHDPAASGRKQSSNLRDTRQGSRALAAGNYLRAMVALGPCNLRTTMPRMPIDPCLTGRRPTRNL
jgi:hypothetical protein